MLRLGRTECIYIVNFSCAFLRQSSRVQMLMRLMRERYLAVLGACWDVERRGTQQHCLHCILSLAHKVMIKYFVLCVNRRTG